MGLTPVEYGQHLRGLLPRGHAWTERKGSTLEALAEGMGEEFAAADDRLGHLRDEVDPFLTLELLPEWERVLGLPDPCVTRTLTTAERRAAVVARLGEIGGQSRAFYQALAAALGFPDVQIIEYRPATCVSDCTSALTGGPWRHTWAVLTTLDRVTRATCVSTCVEPLASWGNDTLECALNRVKPAHTVLLFLYVPDPQPENLIFVYLDDAYFWSAWNDVVQFPEGDGSAPYLNRYPASPVVDSLVATGIRALNAKATSVCSPGRAGFHAGVYESHHGLGQVVRSDADGEAREFNDPGFEWRTIAEKLARVDGLQTGIFGKLHLFEDEETEDGLGYAGIEQRLGPWTHYELTRANLGQPPAPEGEIGDYYAYQVARGGVGEPQTIHDVFGPYATKYFFDKASAWIRSRPAGTPFFCMIPLHAPHAPFQYPPPEAIHTDYFTTDPPSAFKLQLSMQEAVDYYLGRFLAELPPEIREKTTVVVMSDNGADGTVLESGRDDDGKDFGPTWDALIDDPEQKVKQSVFRFGLEAQLVWSDPAAKTPGRTTTAPIHISDLHATVLAYFGAPILDDEPTHGLSVLAHLRDEAEPFYRWQGMQFSSYFKPNGHPQSILPAAANWSAGTNYAIGTEVNHRGRVYIAQTASGPAHGGPVEPGTAGSSTEWFLDRYRDHRLEMDVTGQPGGPDFNGRWALIRRLAMPDRLIQLFREDGTPVDPFELGAGIDLLFGSPAHLALHALLEARLEEALELPPGPRDSIRIVRADGEAGSLLHDEEGHFPYRRRDGVLGQYVAELALGDFPGFAALEKLESSGLLSDGGLLMLAPRIPAPSALGVRRADGFLGRLPLEEDGLPFRNAATLLGVLTVEGEGGGVTFTNAAGTEGTLLLI